MRANSYLSVVILVKILNFSHGLPNGITKFPKDYTYLETTHGMYKYHDKEANFTEAIKICETEGAELFYPEDEEEATAVLNLFKKGKVESQVWAAVSKSSRNDMFKTIDGRPLNQLYHKWNRGLKNPIFEDNCVILWFDGTIWTYPCNGYRAFICKYTPGVTRTDQQHNSETSTTQTDLRNQRVDATSQSQNLFREMVGEKIDKILQRFTLVTTMIYPIQDRCQKGWQYLKQLYNKLKN